MAFTYTRFTDLGVQAGSSAASVYTRNNSNSPTDFVRTIVLHNTNSTSETVNVWAVPDNAGSAGTAADANRIFSITLIAGETNIVDFPAPGIPLLYAGESIQVASTTASKVSVLVTGARESF